MCRSTRVGSEDGKYEVWRANVGSKQKLSSRCFREFAALLNKNKTLHSACIDPRCAIIIMKTSVCILVLLFVGLACNTSHALSRSKLEGRLQHRKQPQPSPGGASAISDLTLLLPHTSGQKNEVRYKLEAYNSCFRW